MRQENNGANHGIPCATSSITAESALALANTIFLQIFQIRARIVFPMFQTRAPAPSTAEGPQMLGERIAVIGDVVCRYISYITT